MSETTTQETLNTVKPMSFTLLADDDPNLKLGTINVDIRQTGYETIEDAPSSLSDDKGGYHWDYDLDDTNVRAARAIAAFEAAWENETTTPEPEPEPETEPDPTVLDLTPADGDWRERLKLLGFHYVEDETNSVNIPTLINNKMKVFEHWSHPDCSLRVAFSVTNDDTDAQPVLFSFTTRLGVTANITPQQLMTFTSINAA